MGDLTRADEDAKLYAGPRTMSVYRLIDLTDTVRTVEIHEPKHRHPAGGWVDAQWRETGEQVIQGINGQWYVISAHEVSMSAPLQGLDNKAGTGSWAPEVALLSAYPGAVVESD